MGNISIQVWRNSTDISSDSREGLMSEFDRIADEVWNKKNLIYKSNEEFYFNNTTGLALAKDGERLVAYNIYKRLRIFGKNVIYSASTTVRPEYQSRGLRSRIIRNIVFEEQCTNSGSSIFLALRTRNPIAWHVFSRCCNPIVPDYRNISVINEELIDLGVAAANEIFPKLKIERPAMIMRNAFDWLTFIQQPTHKDTGINDLFFRDLSETDGIFAIGRARSDLLTT